MYFINNCNLLDFQPLFKREIRVLAFVQIADHRFHQKACLCHCRRLAHFTEEGREMARGTLPPIFDIPRKRKVSEMEET
ncbi:unnamed protein product [Arctogadus glacialis]